MAEYIDREIAKDVFCEKCLWERTNKCSECKHPIDNVPPADVRPLVRSHWKKNDNGTYSCERCHSWIPEEQWHYANWCLYCGADMRGGDAE